MHSLPYASQPIDPATSQASAFGHVPGYSGSSPDYRQGGYAFDPLSTSANDDIRINGEQPGLDLLVADIANLARAYMHRGKDDSTEVLDAVCVLLGSALRKMRDPTSGIEPEASVPAIPSRPRGGIAPSALRRVREHIDRNLGEHIEIADLASLTGLSPCHFSRAFKQSMGMPPHRYLISRRVQEATRLFESTDRPMFEIALDVGFSDQSHFTRVFSAQVGESPSQFRHQRR